MYLILDADTKVHGPLDLPAMELAIEEGRIRPHSLVSVGDGRWHLAFSIPELREVFLKHRQLHEPEVTHLSDAQTFEL
jgi:hypothetical protein